MKSQAVIMIMAVMAAMMLSFPFLASAQTSTECNPLLKTCPANRALGRSASFDFTQGAGPEWTAIKTVTYGSEGAEFTVAKSGDNPLIRSNFYIMFGHVELVMKAAPGVGIVSSAFLNSDCLDEIDWEWLGGNNVEVQTNYFGKGRPAGYNRSGFHSDPGNQDTFKTYTIDWNEERIIWQIDGATIRSVRAADANGQYPQTPAYIRVGVWAGGDSTNDPGTIEWAGGSTNYANGPYTMYVRSVAVTDYSTGSQYQYSDNSCSLQSIKSIGGRIGGGVGGQGSQNSENVDGHPENDYGYPENDDGYPENADGYPENDDGQPVNGGTTTSDISELIPTTASASHQDEATSIPTSSSSLVAVQSSTSISTGATTSTDTGEDNGPFDTSTLSSPTSSTSSAAPSSKPSGAGSKDVAIGNQKLMVAGSFWGFLGAIAALL